MGSWFSREHVSINDLSDVDLLNIFKHLPSVDRLTVSEVCYRWYDLSRIPWRDVVKIDVMVSEVSRRSRGIIRNPWRHAVSNDFTPIPIKHLPAIVKQCPNLRSITACCAGVLDGNVLHILSRAPLLATVKLYNANVSVPLLGVEHVELFTAMFSERLLNATWEELVLSNVSALAKGPYRKQRVAGSLPLSLQRLQLSGLNADGLSLLHCWDFPSFLDALGRLQNLSRLILSGAPYENCPARAMLFDQRSMREFGKLQNLRELCIGENGGHEIRFRIRILLALPKLQVFFLFGILYYEDEADDLPQLITTHPCLRILALTGWFSDELTIPVRRVYPNFFGSKPLPLLHVFLGQQPSEKIRFTKSHSDALKVYTISGPLPTFLEREEISPIFDGVWIAAQIKEGAKHGSKWYNSESTPPRSYLL